MFSFYSRLTVIKDPYSSSKNDCLPKSKIGNYNEAIREDKCTKKTIYDIKMYTISQ